MTKKPKPTRKGPLTVYLPATLLEQLDEWRARQDGEPGRSDAVRRMVARTLRADAEKVSA
ncbi:MAG: ribbon-helix-helix protein, CopG family [Bradyrhizobiaceae bacterium]|nr:ribbon-helix-helix protein, CopG family [Bradyrhizobiaceae bacterium]